MDNKDEVIDLNPTDTAFLALGVIQPYHIVMLKSHRENESISLEHVKQENMNGSSDNKYELPTDTAFNNESISVEHVKQENISEENINGSSDNKIELSQKAEKKVWRCDMCGYQSLKRSNLYQHKKIHLAPEKRKIFACIDCDKKYTTKQMLQCHLEDYHTDPRSKDGRKNIHKCSICGYQTRNISYFKTHKQIHLAPEERTLFACIHCDKKYKTKPALKLHITANHIDSRSKDEQKNIHKCSICSYQTRNITCLKQHKRVHLALEERKLFDCVMCDKKYTTKQMLQRHFNHNHIDSG